MMKYKSVKQIRAQKVKAWTMVLRQARGQAAYATQDRIFEGQELVDLRKKLVDGIINLRSRPDTSEMEQRESRNSMSWSNYASLVAGRSRLAASKGEVEAPDRHLANLIRSARMTDPGSTGHVRILRRAIRRILPNENFDDRPALPRAFSSDKELAHIATSARKKGYILRADLPVLNGNMVLKKDAPAFMSETGNFMVNIPGHGSVNVPHDSVRKVRLRDRKRLDRQMADSGYEPDLF